MIADLAINLSIGVSIFAVALALAGQITIWITLKAPQRREISFSGTPVDKRDCQELMTQCHAVHDQIFNRISGVERGVEARVTKIEDQLKETERRLDEKAEKRAVHLHNRVNHINSGINRIAGKLGLQLSTENDYSE